MSRPEPATELRRDLGLLDAVMLNVGSVIGSGIFFVPAAIAAHTQSPPMVLVLWLVGGVVSLFGALTVAELGAASPRAGGLYVYLREAYGPLLGFLYGWTSFWVINTASVAAIAVAFGDYVGASVGFDAFGRKTAAVVAIAVLTLVNCLGVRRGALVQNLTGLFKVGALVFLGVAVLALPGADLGHVVGDGFESPSLWQWSGLGVAMVGVLWSYDGWIEVSYAAGEIREPRRNVPLALLWSMVLIIAVYLLVNTAYLAALSLDGVRGSERVAGDAAAVVLGDAGVAIMAAAVLVSTFGAANGFLLGAARIYYAMAREGLFFGAFARVHPRFGTPAQSLIRQGLWATVLALTGSFERLFAYVVFASWLFYALVVAAVFVMRRRRPPAPGSYRTPGYPWAPALFIAFALALVANAFWTEPLDSAIGLGLVLSGVPVYLLWLRPRR